MSDFTSSVFRGASGACGHAPPPPPPPPSERPKKFLTRHTVKNGISSLYILLKCALKMQEMPFQGPKIQQISLTKIRATLLDFT